jgi:Abnormal spindle-like microcephaly-assoc'd, ASPM-SPD-2-Hydin
MVLSRPHFLLIFFFWMASCSESEILVRYQDRNASFQKSVTEQCSDNSNCQENEVCIEGRCVKASQFPCQNQLSPLLHISASAINFAPVRLNKTVEKEITLSNWGNCTLIISTYSLDSNSKEGFSCPRCEGKPASILIAPTQSTQLKLHFSPKKPGPHSTLLTLVSNDFSINPDGKIQIPVTNTFDGKAKIVLQPSDLSWGYIPYNFSNSFTLTKKIRISNFGTNSGTIFIESISIEGDLAFFISSEFTEKFRPMWLEPTLKDDPSSFIEVPINFLPHDFEKHRAKLIVTAHYWGEKDSFRIEADLSASSKGQPKIKLSQDELLFRSDRNEPLLAGSVTSKEIKITNLGESELIISNIGTLTQNGFSFFPSFLPAIFPGESVTVNVFFVPEFVHIPASSSQNFSIQKNKFFILSNDPQKPSTSIALLGWAKNSEEETLTVEMSFENAASGWSGDDFRNVDLELISPSGFSCTKPDPHYSSTGNLDGMRDYCSEWNNFLKEGIAHWVALGVFEKPERVSLYGFNPLVLSEQIFTARVRYVEDCSYMPGALLANLLGIGTGLLTSILSGQVGATVAVSPGLISTLISKHCIYHSPTQATLHFLINGREVASPQVLLYQKGDFVDVMKIYRRNNHFEVTQ